MPPIKRNMQDIVLRLAIVLLGLYALYKFSVPILLVFLWGCYFVLTVVIAFIPAYILFSVGVWVVGADSDAALDSLTSGYSGIVYLILCGLISLLITYAASSDPGAFSESRSRRRY